MKQQIKKFINIVVSIILPNYCEVCRNIIYGNNKNICINCINEKMPFIDKDNYKRCIRCFNILVDSNICKCENEETYYNKVSSLFYYKEPLVNLIHLMKFSKRYSICFEFGFLLSFYRREYILENDYIIPIPLNKKRLLSRGYNQSIIIGETVSKKIGIKTLNNAVIRIKETKALSSMDSVDNRKNEISNAFIINKKYIETIKNKNILIIDDVFTTGSTSNEIAKILKEHEVKTVNILTVSRV